MARMGNTKAWLEIIAVVLTAAGKFLFMDFLNVRLPFIAGAMVFWLVYIVWHVINDRERTRHWGFRLDNLTAAVKMLIPFAIFSCVSFFVVGYFQHSINFTWHIFPVLIMYPLWGTIQQFLLISLVAGNLRDIDSKGRTSVSGIVLIAALLFGLIHYPWYWLMAGTFVLALLYGFVFLRERNVFALGIFHGWLGALFFYTVVNRDPFVEVFGKYL